MEIKALSHNFKSINVETEMYNKIRKYKYEYITNTL